MCAENSRRSVVFRCAVAIPVALALVSVARAATDGLNLEMVRKVTTGVTIADCSRNSALDIIISGTGGGGRSLRIVDGLDLKGATLPVNLSTLKIGTVPAIADLNDDGKLETVFGNDAGYVTAFGVTREKLWQYESGGGIRSSPVTVDLDGDGALEVVFGNSNGEVTAVTGNAGKRIRTSKCIGPISSSPAAGDLDEDVSVDIVVGSEDGRYTNLWGERAPCSGSKPKWLP